MRPWHGAAPIALPYLACSESRSFSLPYKSQRVFLDLANKEAASAALTAGGHAMAVSKRSSGTLAGTRRGTLRRGRCGAAGYRACRSASMRCGAHRPLARRRPPGHGPREPLSAARACGMTAEEGATRGGQGRVGAPRPRLHATEVLVRVIRDYIAVTAHCRRDRALSP